jgi:hypothetical protein
VNFSIVTLVNNDDVYNNNVLKTSRFPNVELIKIETTHCCKGLNRGIELASSDIVICCHQDVAFPDNWVKQLEEQLALIKDDWGVIGAFGKDYDYRPVGNIYNPYPTKLEVQVDKLPMSVLSIDELCLIINKNNSICFDNNWPWFHTYASDICLYSLKKGLKNYIINLQVNHLSPKGTINQAYFDSINFLLYKWHNISPVKRYVSMCFDMNFVTKKWRSYL